MAKMFSVIRMQGGSPEINQEETPYYGYVLAAQLKQEWGCYIISGTPKQLQAINALPQVYGICLVTENDTVKWAELDDLPTELIRDRLNTWLSNHDYPAIPASWTNRRIVREIFKRLNPNFEIGNTDIADVPA